MTSTGILQRKLYDRISQYEDLHDQVKALRRLTKSYRQTRKEDLLELIEEKEGEIDQILLLLDE